MRRSTFFYYKNGEQVKDHQKDIYLSYFQEFEKGRSQRATISLTFFGLIAQAGIAAVAIEFSQNQGTLAWIPLVFGLTLVISWYLMSVAARGNFVMKLQTIRKLEQQLPMKPIEVEADIQSLRHIPSGVSDEVKKFLISLHDNHDLYPSVREAMRLKFWGWIGTKLGIQTFVQRRAIQEIEENATVSICRTDASKILQEVLDEKRKVTHRLDFFEGILQFVFFLSFAVGLVLFF